MHAQPRFCCFDEAGDTAHRFSAWRTANTGGVTSARPQAAALHAREVAAAATLAAVSVTVVTVGALLPRVGALELLAMVPLALLADRFRLRALIASVAAAAATCFLIGGITAGLVVVASGMVGGVVGCAHRRGRGAPTMAIISVTLAAVAAAAAIGLLALLPGPRTVALDAVAGTVSGIAQLVDQISTLAPLAQALASVAGSLRASWWLWIALLLAIAVPAAVFTTWRLLVAILARLDWIRVDDPLESPVDSGVDIVCPVPVELHQVVVRHPGQSAPALNGVDLRIDPGEFVVVNGHNGSGKSTLAMVLAGLAVAEGAVERPGSVGLGRPGGTALLAQRAEVAALGARVVDDILWGLEDPSTVDLDALLRLVGLPGLADRTTASLSGGQLQRLALAAALARRPALLIADEATAMVDPEGRETLAGLLAELPGRFGTTVVHVSHNPADAQRADRVVRMRDGRVESDAAAPRRKILRTRPNRVTAARRTGAPQGPILRVRDAQYTHALGTPWQHRALTGIDLDLAPGDGLLITGENGSGKTTLAWILAGLLRPTAGWCEIDGVPVAERVGSVALSFQHSRLQLQKRTVREDILSAARKGAGTSARDLDGLVVRALTNVGLPPDLADRGIDALSGGQQRRVAIAGILAGEPRVLVLDEPFAGLDPAARTDLAAHLAAVRDERGLAIAVVSHDLDGLERLCPRVLRLEGGTPA